MKILAIITARCGSKGLPNKNFIKLCGKPLVDYTVEEALCILLEGLISDIYLSTDSIYLLNRFYEKTKIKCPLRCDSFAGDTIKSVEVIKNVLDECASRGKVFTDILLLQPTSPLRTSDDLRDAIKAYKTSRNQSLISVIRLNNINPNGLYIKKKDNTTNPLMQTHNEGIRRQDEGILMQRNGAIYMCSVAYLRDNGTLISNDPVLYEMPVNRSVDINVYSDIHIAEQYLSKTIGYPQSEFSVIGSYSKIKIKQCNTYKQLVKVELLVKALNYEKRVYKRVNTNNGESYIYFNGEAVFHLGQDVTEECEAIKIEECADIFNNPLYKVEFFKRLSCLLLYTKSIVIFSRNCAKIIGICHEKLVLDLEKYLKRIRKKCNS